MYDPVLTPSGISYERESIVKWLESGHADCPITRTPLSESQLVSNIALKKVCAILKDFKAKSSGAHDHDSKLAAPGELRRVMDDLIDAKLAVQALKEKQQELEDELTSFSESKLALADQLTQSDSNLRAMKIQRELENLGALETQRWIVLKELESDTAVLEKSRDAAAAQFDQAMAKVNCLLEARNSLPLMSADEKDMRVKRASSRVLKDRGNAAMRRGDVQCAERCYRDAIATFQPYGEPVYYTNLAIAQMQLGQFVDAIKSAKEALKINTNWIKAYRIIGSAYVRLGDTAKALAEGYGPALEISPHDQESSHWFGMLNDRLTENARRRERQEEQEAMAHPPFGAAFDRFLHESLGLGV
ncbi:U-box domain [Carpediemonas membranifera]|uniref:RING-type E3 ubiquitin transferase n=1 Tax=Carpediemonas membranifera TaxID=201153 RepID=A0A8J6APX9_9EUKA|nr:U-box domain [Carpediemonas membranifera]|eukprot:KAG9390676.1 U-box domain [Carpediemonas membranifera]